MISRTMTTTTHSTTCFRAGAGARLGARIAVAALALALCGPAGVATAQTGERVPATAATTSQKALLVENMTERSIAAHTIEQSGDEEAIAKLNEARRLVAEAKQASADGRYEEADDMLDTALQLINTEARRLSETEVTHERAAEIYDRRRRAVEAFLTSYKRIATDTSETGGAGQQSDSGAIEALVARADELAAADDYAAAQTVLDQAYEQSRDFIRMVRDGQTLTRSLNFETAQEEYEYELNRNDSFFALLQYAIVEKNPRGTVVERIEANRQQATDLRTAAETAAQDGDYPGAIGSLTEATDLLLKSIRMSGIFIPG